MVGKPATNTSFVLSGAERCPTQAVATGFHSLCKPIIRSSHWPVVCRSENLDAGHGTLRQQLTGPHN